MKEDEAGITAALIDRFTDLRGKEVLEIGCGDGSITGFLSGRPKRLVAIDPDARSVAEACARISGADFRVGSGESLDFFDQTFDLVFFTRSLHHQKVRRALQEAFRVLRTDGLALILEPIAGSEIDRVCRLFHDESHALAMARASIRVCDFFFLEKKAAFDTKWVFESREELIDWLFEYYRRPFDRELASRVERFLGSKGNAKPLPIQDRLVLMSLHK